MSDITSERGFLDTLYQITENHRYYPQRVIDWLGKHWRFCRRCRSTMRWTSQGNFTDRTTGEPTKSWVWSCPAWTSYTYANHDAYEDFILDSPEPPSPTPPTTQDTIDTIDSISSSTPIPTDLKSYLYLPYEDEPWES
jgi:hypothetical protein